LLSTTWYPAATVSLATVPPIIPLPMIPTVVMTAPTPDRARSFRRRRRRRLPVAGSGPRRGLELVRDDQFAQGLTGGFDLADRGDLARRRGRGGARAQRHVADDDPGREQQDRDEQPEKRSEAALRAAEAALEILLGAGFDPQQASEIARSTLWTGIMLVMSEPGWAPELSGDERAEEQRRNEIFLAMLPAARYPRLVECATPMANCDPEFHYRLGVELFIAGVRAVAERQRRDPGGS
jgi:hypothetical protein